MKDSQLLKDPLGKNKWGNKPKSEKQNSEGDQQTQSPQKSDSKKAGRGAVRIPLRTSACKTVHSLVTLAFFAFLSSCHRGKAEHLQPGQTFE